MKPKNALWAVGVALCLGLSAWAAERSLVTHEERADGTVVETGTDSFGARFQRFSATTPDGTMTTVFTDPDAGGAWQTKTEIAEYADGRDTREEVFKRKGRDAWERVSRSARPKKEIHSR